MPGALLSLHIYDSVWSWLRKFNRNLELWRCSDSHST